MPELGFNIDHVATLREARYRDWKQGLPPEPSVLDAARIAEKSGVHAITVHLREDRRHIQDADVQVLAATLHVPLNLEMAVTPAMLQKALLYKPADVCLVPENRREVTTEGGLDVVAEASRLADLVPALRHAGIRVSAFIDADSAQIEAARKAGADAVELHTGTYANAITAASVEDELRRHIEAAQLAQSLGLQVNAGHGLHYSNLRIYLERVPRIHTLNIGHAIVARAVFVGLGNALREMLDLMV